MTQEEAQAIYDQYNGRAGRKPANYNDVLAQLGITPTTSNKENYIYKNEDVADNEKFRYVRIKQIQNMNSCNMTPQAHHLLLALMTSPNSNSLGAFKISISEMSSQTGGQDKDTTVKALNELIILGEVRYIDGVIYLNKFLTNQKQHGNKDNLIGIIKNYNQLQETAKLPYIGVINYQQMNMTQLINEFNKMMKAIEMMGIVASGAGVNIQEYSDVYSEDQINEIIENDKHSFASTSITLTAPTAPALLVVEESIEEDQVVTEEETQVDEVLAPNDSQIEVPQLEEVSSPQIQVILQPVDKVLNSQDEFERILQGTSTPQPTIKLNDEEIIDIIIENCGLPSDSKDTLLTIINDNAFNTLHRYIAGGAKDSIIIQEHFKTAMEQWGINQRNSA